MIESSTSSAPLLECNEPARRIYRWICEHRCLLLAVLTLATIWFFRIEAGLGAIYFQTADQDLILVTQALLINSDEDTHFFHPGYFTIVGLAAFIRAANSMGLIEVLNFADLKSASSLTAALNELASVARIYSLFCITVLAAVFWVGMRLVSGNKLAAVLLTYAFIASQGVFTQSMILRTEVLSIAFLLLGCFLLLDALRNRSELALLELVLFGAALYCAILNKVQAGLFIYAIPVLCFTCGKQLKLDLKWLTRLQIFGWPLLLTLGTASFLFLLNISWIFLDPLRFEGRPGLRGYHLIIVAVPLLSALVLILFHKRRIRECLLGLVAVWIGILIGYTSNFLFFNADNHRIVVYFLDDLVLGCATTECQKKDPQLILNLLSSVTYDSLSSKLSWNAFLEYPTTLLYWVIVSSIALLVWQRKYHKATMVSSWLGLAWCYELAARMRWPNSHSAQFVCYYYIFVEPFLFVALALLVRNTQIFYRRSIAICCGMALITLSLVNSAMFYQRYHHNRFPGLSFHQTLQHVCDYIGYTPKAAQYFWQSGSCMNFVKRDYMQWRVISGQYPEQ